MRCYDCPLSFAEETDWETGECDIICAVTMEAIDCDGACRRSNKWIMSQNARKLIDDYLTREGEAYEKYMRDKGYIS